MGLNVLMMGGRRCGKTSALAGLFEQIKRGSACQYVTVADNTRMETKEFELHDSLIDKILELQNLLCDQGKGNKTFLVDRRPTPNCFSYNLRFSIPGTHHGMEIEFRDVPGMVFDIPISRLQETEEFVKDCDVFVIVIDTPYLMGSTNEETKDFCPEVINLVTNRVDDIRRFLTYMIDKERNDAKMVFFVPLKCEKWAKEPEGLDKVTKRVKEVYGPLIDYFRSFGKMNISILPMQTAGNILFSEFRRAYIYHSAEKGYVRCCKIDDETIRTEKGDIEILDTSEMKAVTVDPEANINGTYIYRPYSWYRINPNDNSFSPHNCDQLMFHIFRFLILAYRDDEAERKRSGLLRFFHPANKYQQWLGTIKINELEHVVMELLRSGILKDSGDGIEIIKKF